MRVFLGYHGGTEARILFLVLVPLFCYCDEADWKSIAEGVKEIAAPGAPGTLSVFAKDAFPVVVGGEPVVAAAKLGKGRIVALAHTGYLDAGTMKNGDTGRLLQNSIRWASGGKKNPTVRVVNNDGLAKFLAGCGFSSAEQFDVVITWQSDIEDTDSLKKAISSGKGLVVADCPWGWLQLNPGKSLVKEHKGNKVLAEAGIVFADGYAEKNSKDGFTVSTPSGYWNADFALQAIETDGQLSKDSRQIATRAITKAIVSIPEDDKLFLPKLKNMTGLQVVPTEKEPVRADMAMERIALTIQIEQSKRLPPERVKPHPAAAKFPGNAVGSAVEKTFEITEQGGWHSTGLYAPAGKIINVDAAAGTIRIGCHSDTIWHLDDWKRAPDICVEFPASQKKIASTFGGLIYIEGGKGRVKISGAIEAPYFVRGKTKLQDWREKIRNFPAPWAELESGKVILTVPSSEIRKLDDPEELLKEWDKGLDAAAEFVGISKEREHPQRYVTDIQISAGYMHSGYPIMTHLDAAAPIVDKKSMQTDWGLWHEMGHNHQDDSWTFDGTGEVTNNVICLYVIEKLSGKKAGDTHEALRGDLSKKAKDHHDAGADFERWKSDPFLALTMYVQLQQSFGWDTFKKVFAEYRTATDLPKNEAEKRDQWMVRFSRAVGKNLAPFFQWWGVPTSESARKSIADLPDWMP